ncbi:hypothetical protein HN51_017894 [Arachis hypogaea]
MALTIEEVIVVEGTTGVVDKVATAAAMVLKESKAAVVLVSGGYGRHVRDEQKMRIGVVSIVRLNLLYLERLLYRFGLVTLAFLDLDVEKLSFQDVISNSLIFINANGDGIDKTIQKGNRTTMIV